MHWFVWFLIITQAAAIGVCIAKLNGYTPKPSSTRRGWIGLLINALILVGLLAYLT